jgi:Protein of unknown function (DUF2934)
MPRKTTGSVTTRGKKGTGSVPSALQPTVQVSSEAPKNGKRGNPAIVAAPANIEEEIRRRAYELYLQRRATAGGMNGSENQDWLIAEREILSRLDGRGHHTA